jgi:hypothetical protein
MDTGNITKASALGLLVGIMFLFTHFYITKGAGILLTYIIGVIFISLVSQHIYSKESFNKQFGFTAISMVGSFTFHIITIQLFDMQAANLSLVDIMLRVICAIGIGIALSLASARIGVFRKLK